MDAAAPAAPAPAIVNAMDAADAAQRQRAVNLEPADPEVLADADDGAAAHVAAAAAAAGAAAAGGAAVPQVRTINDEIADLKSRRSQLKADKKRVASEVKKVPLMGLDLRVVCTLLFRFLF